MKSILRTLFLPILFAPLLVLFSGSSVSAAVDAPVVNWTGHGTTGGACDSIGSSDDLAPGPGQQGWLFVLTSPFDSTGSALTATFSDGSQEGPIAGTHEGQGSYHYVVYAAIGATLTSALATNGTHNSNLSVSHCELGVQTPGVPEFGLMTGAMAFLISGGAFLFLKKRYNYFSSKDSLRY